MKLKTKIRRGLVISCHFLSFLDRGPSLNPEPSTFSQNIIEVFTFWRGISILTRRQWFSGSGNPLTNNMWVLSQSKLCIQVKNEWAIQGEKTERQVRRRQQRKITPPGLSTSWLMFLQSLLDFWSIQKAIYWWRGCPGAHECSSWNPTWGETETKMLFFRMFFVLRCTICYFIYFHYFIFKCPSFT